MRLESLPTRPNWNFGCSSVRLRAICASYPATPPCASASRTFRIGLACCEIRPAEFPSVSGRTSSFWPAGANLALSTAEPTTSSIVRGYRGGRGSGPLPPRNVASGVSRLNAARASVSRVARFCFPFVTPGIEIGK